MEEISTYTVKLKSTGAMKMHMYTSKDKPPETLSDSEIAERYAYRMPNGNLAFPTKWVYGALVEAATKSAQKGQKKAESDKISRMVRISPPMVDLGITKYRVSKDVVMNRGRMGTSTEFAIKPLIEHWAAEMEIQTTIPKRELQNLMEYAGAWVGVGSDRKHGFGLFAVEHIKEK